MRVDPATMLDLSILDPGEESASLASLIDRTRSEVGRRELRRRMRQLPPTSQARDQQLAVRHLAGVSHACLKAGFLAARITANGPVFDYQLQSGISSQRLGMVLLEREGVAPALAAAIERRQHRPA